MTTRLISFFFFLSFFASGSDQFPITFGAIYRGFKENRTQLLSSNGESKMVDRSRSFFKNLNQSQEAKKQQTNKQKKSQKRVKLATDFLRIGEKTSS